MLKLRSLLFATPLSLCTLSLWAQTPAPTASTQTQYPIEEVIVTVTKRAESVQEISSAVSAFSGEMLKQNNIQDYQALADLTPNMQTRSEDKITIRGVGRSRDSASPVAFHVNGVFLGVRGEPFYDLGALEVLRGPSGTVFGRNATAGAINAKWRRPEPEWQMGGDYRQSNRDEQQLRFFVNAPLLGEDDTRLLARFAAVARKQDGLIDNEITPDDEDDPYATDDHFIRAYITSEVTDNLMIGLRAIRYYNRPGGINAVASPSLSTRRGGNLERLGAETLPDDLTIVRSTLHQRFPQNYSKFSRVDMDLTWTINDVPWLGTVDIDLVGGVMRDRQRNLYDLDGTEEPITDGINLTSNVRRNAELRFTSQYDSGFDWLAGLFWYRSVEGLGRRVFARTQATQEELAFLFNGFPGGSGIISATPKPPEDARPIADVEAFVAGQSTLDYSKAVFASMNFDLATLLGITPDIRITAGIRENRDIARIEQDSSTITIVAPIPGAPIVNDQNISIAGEFEATTGEFGAKWFMNDNAMLYAKFSKGYKPGLIQRIDAETNAVDPEFLESIEVGLKTSLFDNSLVMNLTWFRYDYTDLQVFKIISTGVRVDNAGRAFIDGVELELQWSPTANFYTQASVSYLDARFDEFCGRDDELEDTSTQPGCTGSEPHNFEGAQLADAPMWSASLLARYVFNLGDFGTLTPMLKYSWVDDFARREYGNPLDDIDAFSNTSVRLVWESPQQAYKAELFAENIEDHDDIFFDHFSMVPAGDYSMLTVNPPRVVGLSMEVSL